MKHGHPTNPNTSRKDNRHKSPNNHVRTFWSLLYVPERPYKEGPSTRCPSSCMVSACEFPNISGPQKYQTITLLITRTPKRGPLFLEPPRNQFRSTDFATPCPGSAQKRRSCMDGLGMSLASTVDPKVPFSCAKRGGAGAEARPPLVHPESPEPLIGGSFACAFLAQAEKRP